MDILKNTLFILLLMLSNIPLAKGAEDIIPSNEDRGKLRNWKCIEMRAELVNPQNCTICGKEDIKYVHKMKHFSLPPYWTDHVDYICAGMLECNPELAEARDNKLKLRVEKEHEWPNLNWEEKKGKYYLKTMMDNDHKTHSVTIERFQFSKYGVTKIDNKKCKAVFAHNTLYDAKMGAFEILWPSMCS